jgi:hypothetical protein
MKHLYGALFMLIIATTGCATDNPDAAPPRLSLVTAASEAEATVKLDEIASDAGDEDGAAARIACDTGGGHGICCFVMPDGSFPCVAW